MINAVRQLFIALLFLFAQILLFRNFSIASTAFVFVYLGFLLQLSFAINPVLILFITFIYTISVDTFYNTPGIHTFAALCIMYFRPYILRILTPSGGYENTPALNITYMGFNWYVLYASIMTILHVLIVFMIETLSTSTWWFTLLKIIFTSILTVVTIVLIEMILKPKKSNR
jgi:hypothetical protein